jgi:hypothetical protein
MSAPKNIRIYAMTAKNETSYGVSGSALSTATDGIELIKHPELTLEYAYDGKRDTPAGTYGMVRRNATSGRAAKGQVLVDAKGIGAPAYAGTVVPPNVNPFLLAAGLSSSYSASAIVYQPDAPSNAPKSLVIDAYRRGERWPLTAGYCSFQIDSPDAGGANFVFEVTALATQPLDAAAPAISYLSSSVIPPKAEALNLTIGSWTPKVRNYKFDLKRELAPRVDLNSANGHAGFNPGNRNPTLTVKVESDVLSSFNPYNVMETGTLTAVSFTQGTVALNKFGVSMPQANLVSVKPDGDGTVATWELTFEAKTTTPTANDDFQLIFN